MKLRDTRPLVASSFASALIGFAATMSAAQAAQAAQATQATHAA